MKRTYSQMCRTDKYSQYSSFTWSVWLIGLVFVYEQGGCGFEFSCSHLNFRFFTCLKQGVSRHSGNYRVWIHSETITWNNKNMIMHRIYKYSRHSSVSWPVWLNGLVFVYRSVLTAQLSHLAKWLSVCLRTKWLWVRVLLQPQKFLFSHI